MSGTAIAITPPRPAMTLRDVARRVVWFDPPEQTLANPQLFLAHVMVYGTLEEVLVVKRHYTDADFENVLRNPPAGVFDARSWAYWNLVLGHRDAPFPEPSQRERRLPD